MKTDYAGIFMTVIKRMIVIVGVAAILAFGFYTSRSRVRLDYNEHLSDVAVTIDGEDITLGDLYFYVLYEEKTIEDAANIYNPRRTKDFWNTHINGVFIQSKAKDAVIGMAVHDRIFYRLSAQEGLVLSADEKTRLDNARTDFWADLYDEQKESLPVSYEAVNETIKEIALAEKYADLYAKENDLTVASVAWDGYDYEELKKEHDVRINKKVWNRVIVGDITLIHSEVGFINGYHKDTGWE